MSIAAERLDDRGENRKREKKGRIEKRKKNVKIIKDIMSSFIPFFFYSVPFENQFLFSFFSCFGFSPHGVKKTYSHQLLYPQSRVISDTNRQGIE